MSSSAFNLAIRLSSSHRRYLCLYYNKALLTKNKKRQVVGQRQPTGCGFLVLGLVCELGIIHRLYGVEGWSENTQISNLVLCLDIVLIFLFSQLKCLTSINELFYDHCNYSS